MGILRLLLALTVLNQHFASPLPNIIHSFSAVYIFYMISGFYMAMVITEKYDLTRDGLAKFYGNRTLRIFPVYLIALFVWEYARSSTIFPNAVLAPSATSLALAIDQILILPGALWGNLTLRPESANNLVLGQMYTVALELMFYAIAPFIVRRRLPVLIGLFVIAASYHGAVWYADIPERMQRFWQYDFFPGTLIYFLAGVLAYRFYTVAKQWDYSPWIGYAALPVFIVAGRLSPSATIGLWTNTVSIYAFYALCAAMIPFLFIASKRSAVDRFIGGLSYPLYVVHAEVVSAAVSTYGWAGTTDVTAVIFGESIVLAFALTVIIDRPIERWRNDRAARRATPLEAPRPFWPQRSACAEPPPVP